MFIGILKSITRMTSFLAKEVLEVVRRPGALFSLVLGPFLIMAFFGVGYGGQRRALETLLVVPDSANLPRDVEFYQQYGGPAVRVAGVIQDPEQGRAMLRDGRIDLLVVAPPNVQDMFLAGQQSAIGVEYLQIDPVRDNYARFVADRQVQELNKAIIQQAVGQGKSYVVQRAGTDPSAQIPPEVIAAPTRSETRNLAPLSPTMIAFFAPAVLALVLQHMAVTLTALSMVRERLSGAIDVFRVAPVRTLEILVGKYLAYGFFNLAIATLVTFLMVGLLGVPMLSGPRPFALVIVLLTFASLGLGLLISTVVDSERQAVQLSMLVLLASVFFSGFVLPLDEFLPVARYAAYALPVTHGIRLLQDLMLRGDTVSEWQGFALAAIGLVLFLATSLTLRRNLATAA